MYMGNIKGVAGNARWRGGTQACTPTHPYSHGFISPIFELFPAVLRKNQL